MNNTENLKAILTKIELTKTQRERAKELYTNICNAISEKSQLDINHYSQGSFATKTAIRPFKDGKDMSYDVDVICEVQTLEKKDVTPSELMNIFEKAINDAGYHKYKRWDKCFTVEYAVIDDVEFSIDIIPSVIESPDTLEQIRKETEHYELTDTSIAIPNVQSNKIDWISNNPAGYKSWFEQQTQAYENKYIEFRKSSVVASIEELPEDSATNVMRNVIKILKRLRDVYFSRADSDDKPSSIIIATLVAKLANKLPYVQDEFALLKVIVNELQQLNLISIRKSTQISLNEGFMIPEIIVFENNEWSLKNPANGLDNILNSWNDKNSKSSGEFFNWISDVAALIKNQTSKEVEEIRKSEILYDSFNVHLPSAKQPDFKVNTAKASPWRNK